MNRLLLTAATVLTMAVSSHANAASYTLDSFAGANAFANDYVWTAGVGSNLTQTGYTYNSSGFAFTRSIDFEQTAGVDPAGLFLTDSWVWDPEEEAMPVDGQATVMTGDGINATLRLTYDISSIKSTVGAGSVAFNLNLRSSDAAPVQPLTISAFLNGSSTAFDTWTVTAPVTLGEVPPVTHAFLLSGSSLTGTDQVSFLVSSVTGYNASISPLTFDVLPVPEPGEWAMMGAGLAVVAFAARRKRALNA